jgi:malate dehydrogenase (oxaloacetate-decarboxylating)
MLNDMNDIYERSVNMHREHGGKIELSLKIDLDDKEALSLAYSPGVAGVSRAIAQDKRQAKELTIKKNTIAIVSDGSAILGLGDLGPEAAIPVMEGKAALFKRFADVDAFPICLDTKNVDEIVDVVERIAPVFGGINLEDISAPRCFEIEQRLRKKLSIPVLHDDQHGTAIVVLAGLINAVKVRGGDQDKLKVVMSGVGAAGVAITNILLSWGVKDIILCDSKGIINSKRTDLNSIKKELQKKTNKMDISGNLSDALVGADIFIGVSVAGLLKKEMIGKMNKRPIIFALANPEPEIMPHEATEAGALIIATGRSDFPNQINNVLAFPGLFRGALDHNISQFEDTMFLRAAHAIAACVQEPTIDRIVPDVFDENISLHVAASVQ